MLYTSTIVSLHIFMSVSLLLTWSRKPIPVDTSIVCPAEEPGVQSRFMDTSMEVSLVFLEMVASRIDMSGGSLWTTGLNIA